MTGSEGEAIVERGRGPRYRPLSKTPRKLGSNQLVVVVVTALAVLGWMGLATCCAANSVAAPAHVHIGPTITSPPVASPPPAVAPQPSSSESQNPEADFVSHALAATRAAGLNPDVAYVPHPSATPAQIAEAAEKGSAAPLYTGAPAPMGLADYGLGVANELFVANWLGHNLTVISANRVVASITVGLGPIGMAYDSGNGELYVANYDSDNVSVINPEANSVVAWIPVGTNPYAVAYDGGNGEVYVANWGSGSVSVINGATNSVVATIILGTIPSAVTYDSGNGEVYVAEDVADDVGVISGTSVVATVPVGTYPRGVAYDSANGELYVPNYGSDDVSAICDGSATCGGSGEQNQVVATVSVGSEPVGATYDSGNGDVYVANLDSQSVSAICDGSITCGGSDYANVVVATITVGDHPVAVAYDSGDSCLYVTNVVSNSVSVIRDDDNTVVLTIPVGSGPSGIAYYSGIAPSTLNTTSLEGFVDANATGIQGQDLYQSIPDGFSIQMNAVLTNITLLGTSGYEFWAQDIVTYFPATGFMILVTNIWNYSAPGASVSANAIFEHGPYGHNDYATLGYYYANYTVPYPLSYPFDVTLTMTSSIYDEAYDQVSFGASVASPTNAFEPVAMNNYDDVVFNSDYYAGLPQPSNFTASSGGYNPAHLLDDFELVICGPGGGSQVDLGTADATLALNDLVNGNESAIPSAYNYGSDTGETSVGANVAWSWTGSGSPNGIGPYGTMTTGPSILSGLWGTGAPEGSYPIPVSVYVLEPFEQLPNAFNFFLYTGSAGFSAPIVAQYEYAPMETRVYYLMPGTYDVRTELADFTEAYNVLTVPEELGLNVSLTPDSSLGVYTPLWAFSNSEVPAIAESGVGTPNNPFVLDNNQNGPLSSDFGLYNDYTFPVFPGVFLKDTSVSVELNNSSTFETATNDFQPSPGDELPAFNDLQFWFWNVTGVAFVNDSNISGWFGSQSFVPLTFNSFNVVFYASEHNLVANNRFLTQSQALLMYANGTLYGPPRSTGGNNTVWGNEIVQVTPPLGCAGPLAQGQSCLPLVPYNSGLGLEVGEGYDLIYDNLFETPTTAWLLPLNLYTELPCSWTNDAWNIASQPASQVNFATGFPLIPLEGSVVGGSTQGGNSWWDYGVSDNWANGADNPTGVLPYDENALTLISSAETYAPQVTGYPCPAYYCTTYIYPGGDNAPLTTIASAVTVAPQGLVGNAQWGAVISCGPAKSGGAGPAKSGGAGPAKSGGAGPCSGLSGGGDPPALVLADFVTTAASVNLVLPGGAYSWTPIVPAGFTSSSGGSFVVTGGTPVAVTVPYAPPSSAVLTFAESGLPSGLTWQVTVNGVPESLTTDGGTDSLSFTELEGGSYSYTISAIPNWEQDTLAYTGTVSVDTAPTTEKTLVYVPGPSVSLAPSGPFNYDLGQAPSTLTAATTYSGSNTVTLQWSSGGSATCSLDTPMGSVATYPAVLSTLTPSTASTGTTYYCVVITETGTISATFYSNSAEVTVTADPMVSVAPTGSLSYDVGQTPSALTATITYSGPNSATVEWYGSGSSTCGPGSTNTGDSGGSFTPSTASAGTTWYCAVVSDSAVPGYTSVSNAVEVKVSADPTVSVAPGTVSYGIGQKATAISATVTYTGPNSATVNWYVSTSSSTCLPTGSSLGTGGAYTPGTNAVGTTSYCAVVSDSGVPGYRANSGSGVVTVSVIVAITVTPGQGPVGASVTVSGTGFSASTTLKSLVFDGVSITSCTSGSLTTSGTGSFTCTLKVPSGTSGTSVVATNSGGQTATGVFAVTTVAITVTPGQGPVGATVTVSGTGFSVSTAVKSLVFHGVTITSCTSGSLTTSATGAFSCTLKVPNTCLTLTTVTATDVGGQTASSTFKDTTPAITVTPLQGPVGATVTVSGTGFSVSTAVKSLVFDGVTITSCTSGSLTTSGTGSFSCTFKVPSGTCGTVVTATDAGGQAATAKFTVTTPAITVTPGEGAVGASVTVSGTGFSVSTSLKSLVFDGVTITSCTKGSLTTSSTGTFSCTFKVPSGTSGSTVTATDVGGQTATTKFTVT